MVDVTCDTSFDYFAEMCDSRTFEIHLPPGARASSANF